MILAIYTFCIVYLFSGLMAWGIRTIGYNERPVKAIPYGIFWIITFIKFIYRGFKTVLAD